MEPYVLPAYPAPAGLVSDFDSPDSHILGNYVLHAIVIFFTTIAVLIRVYTRRCIKRFMGLNDCKGLNLLEQYRSP